MRTNLPLALLVSASLIGCASVQPEKAQARWTLAQVEVNWVAKDQIGATCERLGLPGNMWGGCARSKPNSQICEVYVVQPTSFDGTKELETLGHEVWHCFGAKHG